MNRSIVAVIFQEGGKLLTELLRNRPPRRERELEQQSIAVLPTETRETASVPSINNLPEKKEITDINKATSVEAGCVPCAIGHFGTCSGLLNEAMRFARKDGVGSSEVIDRVNICLDELNSMERVDLRPELIMALPEWEKDLANKALKGSRTTRHGLESITSVKDLEKVAAETQSTRNKVGREWFKERLARMPKEEKEKLAEKAIEKLGEEE